MEVKCVAITRNGWGDVWAFDSVKLASLNPIVQYGDAIISHDTKVSRQIPIAYIPALMRVLGDNDAEETIRLCLKATSGLKFEQRRARVDEYNNLIWAVIIRASKQVPEDPTIIVNIIRRDRIMSLKENKTMTEENPDVAPEAAAEAAAKAPVAGKTKRVKAEKVPKEPKAPKEPKEPKAPRPPKFPPDHVIRFGAAADGTPYGPENNPKRAGSASAERFSLYRDGMTVATALAAGVDAGDVTWDVSKGFISVVAPDA